MAGATGAAPAAAAPSPGGSQGTTATPPAAAASYAPPAPAKSSGNSLPWIIGGCGCLLLLAILVAVGVIATPILVAYLDKASEQTTVSLDDTDGATSESSGSDQSTAAQPLRIELTWDEEVDMDLEIWDAAGENLLERSFNLCGEDVKVGSDGREWFEFKKYSDEDDYASGNYIVSLYFADRPEGSTVEQARATLTVTKTDGTTVTRTKVIDWEPGRDQWHAFSINARTGAIVDKDRFIRVQSNNE